MAKRRAQKKPAGKSNLPASLTAAQVYVTCPETSFKFNSTKTVETTHEFIAQSRAVRAIQMGLGIRKPGYNIYVAGIQGTGKTSVIKTFLEKWSADAPRPKDWIYVYDFSQTEQPRAISMGPGEGRRLKKAMEHLVKTLRSDITSALQSEDYENAVNAYLSASNERKSKLFGDLEKRAKTLDFAIKSTRMGIETIPIFEGRPLTEKEYSKLTDAQRDAIEDRRSQLEPEVLDFARKVRAIEQETKDYVERLRNEIGSQVVSAQLDPVRHEFSDNDAVIEFLKSVEADILENLLDFVETEEAQPEQPHEMFLPPEERDRFRRYKINVFVDNTTAKGAPVIIETNPTYYNLFGRIEKNVEHGMYLTDFTMIKAGAVHKASGGYLVLNALDIFKQGSIWDTLKRVLKNRLGYIEDMGEQYSLLPTSGLRPEPIPLDLKVILIGNDDIYHILFDADEDFHKIFKIKADFDHKMERSQENISSYASFVATRSKIESLLPFDRSAISTVVEYGSRLVEDQRFLSTQFGELKDLTIESDFIAREHGDKMVSRKHVEQALSEKYFRVNLIEENLFNMVKNEDILLTVHGEQTGQVNGLAVYDMGDYSFGKLGRITCTTTISHDGVINIERASKLSGKIHDKGVFILTGLLNSMLGKKRPIGLAASICFEQSYGMIDGDSATMAEFVAILSALAGTPVRQHVAMTGSLNQFGEVQPVGGVNEKVEGFWKTCQILGPKNGSFTCLIPRQNSANLMLQRDARDAVESGKLKIIPVASVVEAFEIATGVPLGVPDVKVLREAPFARGSALHMAEDRLEKLHRERLKDRARDKAK
jgi:lon-related putative ATP-dependent protease